MVLRNGLTVRQIRRRLATGRQVPVITAHPQMPVQQVAGSMFSRWSQENFFKYLREQFNLEVVIQVQVSHYHATFPTSSSLLHSSCKIPI